MVLEADDSGDLDEVERGDILLATQWLSGSLYKDSKEAFKVLQKGQSQDRTTSVFLFLLGATGGLQVSVSSLNLFVRDESIRSSLADSCYALDFLPTQSNKPRVHR